MSNDDLIKQLKEERVRVLEQKEALEKQAGEAAARLGQIDEAVSALGGAVQQRPSAPAVPDIIEAAARKMPVGTTFGYASLKTAAAGLYPGEQKKIKTGVYSAVKKLIEAKKFIRTPGGFQLAP